MKNKLLAMLALALLLTLNLQLSSAFAQVTAFTYQGRLDDGANPANGHYDLQFILFNVNQFGIHVGPVLTNSNLAVSNGIFTTTLDFGAGIFSGSNYWLEISVRTNGVGAFTTLVPRQPVTPTPYSVFAENVGAGGIAGGTYGNAVTFSNAANNFSGNFTGSGSALTSVNAATLGGLSSSNFWKLSGNAGANPTNGNFIGTTDNLPVEFKVNGGRALRFEPNTNGAPNIIGGSQNNFVSNGVVGATIGGGGAVIYLFQRYTNSVTGSFGTVGGGAQNTASSYATVSGGDFNTAGGFYATVGGGDFNTVSNSYATVSGGSGNIANGDSATVGGGVNNTASDLDATVGGGVGNTSSQLSATVAGGQQNTASGLYSTVPGGYHNTAGGDRSFAGGSQAHATHDGSFIWADANAFNFFSTMTNQFRVRATGGAAFVTAIDGSGGVTAGVHVLNGDTAWSSISDKNAKKNFQPLNGEAVLEKLAAIPVEKWNYKWESDSNTPHIGPMAQDFKGAFYPGRDDKSISTLEFDGVELAAIQGLNQKLQEKDSEIRNLEEQNKSLAKRLAELERTVQALTEKR